MSDDDSLIGEGDNDGAAEPTDAEMEQLLFDNLSSGSELNETEEEKGPPRKKRKNRLGKMQDLCSSYDCQISFTADFYRVQSESGGKFDPKSLFAAADEV